MKKDKKESKTKKQKSMKKEDKYADEDKAATKEFAEEQVESDVPKEQEEATDVSMEDQPKAKVVEDKVIEKELNAVTLLIEAKKQLEAGEKDDYILSAISHVDAALYKLEKKAKGG